MEQRGVGREIYLPNREKISNRYARKVIKVCMYKVEEVFYGF